MWFIMAYNALAGLHRGVFQGLDGLFYAGPDDDPNQRRWVPLLSEAKGYDSMEEAKAEAYIIWGTSFVDKTLIFLQGPGEIQDQGCRQMLDAKHKMSILLAGHTVTKDELKLMAKRERNVVGLTWRERQIIDIMTKGEN